MSNVPAQLPGDLGEHDPRREAHPVGNAPGSGGHEVRIGTNQSKGEEHLGDHNHGASAANTSNTRDPREDNTAAQALEGGSTETMDRSKRQHNDNVAGGRTGQDSVNDTYSRAGLQQENERGYGNNSSSIGSGITGSHQGQQYGSNNPLSSGTHTGSHNPLSSNTTTGSNNPLSSGITGSHQGQQYGSDNPLTSGTHTGSHQGQQYGSNNPLSSGTHTGSHNPLSSNTTTGSHNPLSSNTTTGSHNPLSSNTTTGSHNPLSSGTAIGGQSGFTGGQSGLTGGSGPQESHQLHHGTAHHAHDFSHTHNTRTGELLDPASGRDLGIPGYAGGASGSGLTSTGHHGTNDSGLVREGERALGGHGNNQYDQTSGLGGSHSGSHTLSGSQTASGLNSGLTGSNTSHGLSGSETASGIPVQGSGLGGSHAGYSQTGSTGERLKEDLREGERGVGGVGSSTGHHGTNDRSLRNDVRDAEHHDTTGTTEHKKASLLDKLNPMKDSDGDGKKGFMK